MLGQSKGVLPSWSWVAAIVGPAVFVAVFSVFGYLAQGYSAYSDVISNLEIVKNGWVQQLNFLQCGTLIIVFAVGFRRAMRPVVHGRLNVSSALMIISGGGMIEASYFTPAMPVEHTLGFLFFMIPLLGAFFLIGRTFLRTSPLRGLGYYSLVTGLTTLVFLLYFFVQGASAPAGAAPAGFTGVVNRVFVVISLAWFVVMGAGLRKPRTSTPSEGQPRNKPATLNLPLK